MMPPAASTGTLRTGLIARITSGTSTRVDTSPQCPPASPPCATMISTPALTWRMACSFAPTKAATGTPYWRPRSIMDSGAIPSAFAMSRIGCWKATSISASPTSDRVGGRRRLMTFSGVILTSCLASNLTTKSQCSAGIFSTSSSKVIVEDTAWCSGMRMSIP